MIITKYWLLPDGRVATANKIVSFEVDFASFDVTLSVGSWVRYEPGTPPDATNTFVLQHYQDWKPEYAAELSEHLRELPAWKKHGATQPNPVRTLEQAREEAWNTIKARREELRWGGFEHDGMRFDSDPNSVVSIAGATQMAFLSMAAGVAYLITFTLQDDTRVELDAAQMISVGQAAGEHVQRLFLTAGDLREQIHAMTNIAQIDALAQDANNLFLY